MAIFDVKHHHGNVLVIIVELLRLVAELGLHLDDAVEGLVGDHSLEPDVQLQEGSRVTAVQSHLRNILFCCKKYFCPQQKIIRPGGDLS